MWNCFPAGRACTCCFKASLSSHSLRLELTQDVEGWDSNVHCYLMWLPQLVSSCKRQIASALTLEFSRSFRECFEESWAVCSHYSLFTAVLALSAGSWRNPSWMAQAGNLPACQPEECLSFLHLVPQDGAEAVPQFLLGLALPFLPNSMLDSASWRKVCLKKGSAHFWPEWRHKWNQKPGEEGGSISHCV